MTTNETAVHNSLCADVGRIGEFGDPALRCVCKVYDANRRLIAAEIVTSDSRKAAIDDAITVASAYGSGFYELWIGTEKIAFSQI